MLAVLALALLVRIAIFVSMKPWLAETVAAQVLVNDSVLYHRLAQCIVLTSTFCGETFRTPAYPLYIAALYSLVGELPWAVLLSQIFLDLISVVLIIRIGELLFNKRVGLFASALYALDPNAAFSTVTLLSEPLFVCTLLAGTFWYLRAVSTNNLSSAFVGGLILAVATLVRPVAEYYFYLLVILAFFWTTRKLQARLHIVVALALSFAATLSPWIYRNYALYDTAGLTTVQGENLLFWQVSNVKSWETGRPSDRVFRDFWAEAHRLGYDRRSNPFHNAKIAQEIAVEYIATHPKAYAYRTLIGISNTFFNLSTAQIVETLGYAPNRLPEDTLSASKNQRQALSTFFSVKSSREIAVGLSVLSLLLIHYSFCLLGVIELISRQSYAVLLIFLCAISYFAIAGGPIGLARFRLPIAPFYLLLAGVFLDSALRRPIATQLKNRFRKVITSARS